MSRTVPSARATPVSGLKTPSSYRALITILFTSIRSERFSVFLIALLEPVVHRRSYNSAGLPHSCIMDGYANSSLSIQPGYCAGARHQNGELSGKPRSYTPFHPSGTRLSDGLCPSAGIIRGRVADARPCRGAASLVVFAEGRPAGHEGS